MIKSEKHVKLDRIVLGGLHIDDFEWAYHEYEELGYILVAFVLDCDGYHWKAVYESCEGEQQSAQGSVMLEAKTDSCRHGGKR